MTPVRSRVFGFVIIVLLIVALPAIILLTRQNQDIRPRALQGQSNLVLSSSATTTTVGAQVDVLVSSQLTDSNLKVSGADVMVLYDKNKLSVANIVPNTTTYDANAPFTDAPYVTSGGSYDSNYNYVRFVVVARKPDAQLIGGTVQLARIRFTPIAEGSATIQFPSDNSLLQIVGIGNP